MPWRQKQAGFTIVELLIVIVVIAILATISIVAYRGIQERGRDSQRDSDIATITKALEMYYIDNGRFPAGSCTSVPSSDCTINTGWSTTADPLEESWNHLAAYLVPKYISKMPQDPVSTPGANPQSLGNLNYGYFGNHGGQYCGPTGQMYILVYSYEAKDRKVTFNGECDTTNYLNLGSYGANMYRVVK